MRLRDLFMILLLCMTVGFFSVACTGDDGEAGPPGPPGPQGEPGEVSDMDIPQPEYSYSFLKTWGSDTGEISCNDSLLKGMGVFPGPESLDPLPDNNNDGQPDIEILEVQCAGSDDDTTSALFDPVTSIKVGLATLAAGTPNLGFLAAELVFLKSTAEMDGPSDPVEVASTETVKAKSVVTTKKFAGGIFYADLDTTGGNVEALQRIDLHANCSTGTPPSEIEGDWRAVRIIEDARSFEANKDKVALDGGGLTRTTTTKVCLRLDSIPGSIKCFVEKQTQTSSSGSEEAPEFADNPKVEQQIAIYDGMAEAGMMLKKVAPKAHKDTKLLPPTTDADGTELGTAANANVAQQFFGTGTANAISDVDVSKLCNLFEEGLE